MLQEIEFSKIQSKEILICLTSRYFLSLQYEQIMIVHYDDLDFKYQLKILPHDCVLTHALVKHTDSIKSSFVIYILKCACTLSKQNFAL